MYHVKSEICCRTLTITLLYFSPDDFWGEIFFSPFFFFFFCCPKSSDLILFQTFNHNHDLNITIDVGDLFFITRFLLQIFIQKAIQGIRIKKCRGFKVDFLTTSTCSFDSLVMYTKNIIFLIRVQGILHFQLCYVMAPFDTFHMFFEEVIR